MKLNKHFLLLIIVLAVIVLITTALTIYNLYNAAFEQQRAQLIATTQSQAKLIEAVARFDQQFSTNDIKGGATTATLLQLVDAQLNSKGFGESGEFVFGKKENNKIIFLLPRRFKDIEEENGQKILLDVGGSYAEPIQLALAGKSGTVIAHDYRGELVLAAYEPVKFLNFGVVTKIDISEIRTPYYRVGIISISVSMLLIILGAYLFARITRPIIKGLQESEQYNRMLFESSPTGLALSSMDGVLVDVNPAYANITGRSIEEVKQLSYWDITPKDYAEEEQRQLESLNSTGHYGPYEKEYFHKDGHRIPVRLLGQIIERNGENFIWSSVEDIHERKEIEAAIKQNEARLNEAQRLAKVGSWELDLLEGELSWSDEIFRMFEIDKSKFDANYEAFLNAIHPDDRDSVNEAYSNSLGDRLPYEITHRLQMSDGTIKYVHETCESYFDEEGNPVRSVGTVQDITEQKVISQDLQQFKETLDKTLDCVFMFDADKLTFSYVNEGALQQIGYSFDELQTMHAYDIKPEISEQQFHELIAPLISGEKESLNFETVHQHKNGEIICVEIFLQYISPENESARFVAIVRDISNRKKAEEEIKELNISLEARVKERTKELESTLVLLTDENEQRKKAENQFREAKEQAEKASAAKSDFLSRMSHELRTPMNAILGFGQLLELDSNKFNESQNSNVQEILEAGNHLLHLINDVLDLTEIEAGKFEISMERVELKDVVPQCISLMEPIAKIRQIKQIDNLSEKGYVLHADFTRLKQVLLNLLSNAVKYNREEGTITLDGEVVDEHYLRISITDTGDGVKEEDMSKLFTSFERLNPTINVEGSGIGLNITKHIVELMGGKVGVTSTLGQGSTFWFELKLS